MKAYYLSEGRIEEVDIPTGGLLPDNYKIHRGTFFFSDEDEARDCIRIFKGDVVLAVVFFNDTIGSLCLGNFPESTCFRFETVCLFANIMDHWDRIMRELPMDHEFIVVDPKKGGER